MTFFVHVVGRSPEAVSGDDFTFAGRVFRTLARSNRESLPSLGASFEEAYAALEAFPRLFIEPDGSFVWVGETPSQWQLDGNLYDHAGRLRYVEVKGACPESIFERFLATLGWPDSPVAFELVELGVRLDEAEFRRFAGWRDSL